LIPVRDEPEQSRLKRAAFLLDTFSFR